MMPLISSFSRDRAFPATSIGPARAVIVLSDGSGNMESYAHGVPAPEHGSRTTARARGAGFRSVADAAGVLRHPVLCPALGLSLRYRAVLSLRPADRSAALPRL